MNVLFVASEMTPLVKVGGLADVVGALPIALRQRGHDVRILLPHYGVIAPKLLAELAPVRRFKVVWQGRPRVVTIVSTTHVASGLPLFLMSTDVLFDGDAIYYEHSGPGGARLAEERYVFFSLAAAQAIPLLDWQPEVVHGHDWHTGLLPALLPPAYTTVHTIHNMEGQGKWRAEEVLAWINARSGNLRRLEYRDLENNLNLLQLAIRTACAVNTVSPRYAQEILGPEYGFGLERDLHVRTDGVHGILNGIDTATFDPTTDSRIATTYTIDTVTKGKTANRDALLRELGLTAGTGPVFGFVGRITSQKGIDLLLPHVAKLLTADARLILLGSGVPDLEQRLATALARYHDRARLLLKFDAALAQRIYAASDFFLMPSRFEPCGLGQMIAMRYGALPIVRDTGGLHDTVRDLHHDRAGTGIVFQEATAAAFGTALDGALRVFADRDTLDAARRRAMQEDNSWQRSAAAYESLYRHAKNANH